ncbi:hypothetical protein MBLNU459_g0579t2 [Dothideomycetes sp. NU459]
MAPRSDEAAAWFAAVYNAVQEIPHGKVTSYGHIARLLGRRESTSLSQEENSADSANLAECPRQVGMCLKHLPSATDQPTAPFNGSTVPWQRVVNAKGTISQRGGSGAARQAAALRVEGVEVGRGALGEYTIDFTTFGWFPDVLPSDLAEDETGSEDEEDAS